MNPVAYPKTLLQSGWLEEEKALKSIKGYQAHDLGPALKLLATAHGNCDLSCFDLAKLTDAEDIAKALGQLDKEAAPRAKTLSDHADKVKRLAADFIRDNKTETAKGAAAAAKAMGKACDALAADMDAAVVNARTVLTKRKAQASTSASAASGKDSLARLPEYRVVRAKVLAALKAAKSAKQGSKPVRFILCVGAKVCMPYAAFTVSATHKPLLVPLMGDDDSSLKYPQGELIWERGAYTFVTESAASGTAAKLQVGLKRLTGAKVPVRVRRPTGEGEELEGGEELPEDEDGPPDSADLLARYKGLAEGILALKAAKRPELTDRLDRAVEDFRRAMTDKKLVDASAILDELDDVVAAALQPTPTESVTRPVPDRGEAVQVDESTATGRSTRTEPVLTDEQHGKVQEVEKRRASLLKVQDELKKKMSDAISGEVRLDELRKLIEIEKKREKSLSDVLEVAARERLPIAQSPARVGFEDNDSPGSSEWTAEVCAKAYLKYGWFDFKALRSSGQPVEVEGLARQTRITDDVMWKLYQYRRWFIDKLIAKLHEKYKDSGLLFKSSGSEDIESDFDITVASPGSGDDVKAMRDFNAVVKSKFGRAPGRVFDCNLYARDYNAIKDNLTANRPGALPVDAPIAEPEGDLSRMADIDQDVATLMKQRRFLDDQTFTAMWSELQSSLTNDQDKQRVQQLYEEGEADYLLTTLEKVDAIAEKVKSAIEKLDANDPRRLAFEKQWAIVDDARKSDSPHVAQRQLPRLLNLLESEFPDEVMEVTDEQYAMRMSALRVDQIRLAKLERDRDNHLFEGPDCDTFHKKVSHTEWAKDMTGGVDALKTEIKRKQFVNIMFANEAYVSQGAITHIVSGKQAADPNTRKTVLEKITPAMLLQSTNEQMADFFKDMAHLEHGEEAARDDTDKRRKTGEAFVHASKYVSRMLEAAALLQDKYAGNPDVIAQLTQPEFDLLTRAKAKSVAELQGWVDDNLVFLRKSATVPGDAKAELAVDWIKQRFQVGTIAELRTLMTAFCVEFNRRVRQLDEFRERQTVSRETERQYFRPV